MRSPIDKAIKTKPGGMQQTIPTDAKPTDGLKSREHLDVLVEGVILWRRDFGLPQGPLLKAFQVDSFAYTNNSFDPLNAHATYQPLRSKPSDVHLEEGPHDNQTYRVTYQVFWQDPQGYGGDFADHPDGQHNYISVAILTPWAANATTGPGTKLISPSKTKFVREKGPMKGPTFSVVHDAN